MSGTRLDAFNRATPAAARELMLACCASRRWADAVAALRPYRSLEDLLQQAQTAWHDVSDDDRLEAFAAHPRIGDVALLRQRFSRNRAEPSNPLGDRANAEQGQVIGADESVLAALATLNQRYLARHGFIFIVCASGRSAGEMLDMLRARIDRIREEEMDTAAEEQGKITALRIAEALG